MNIANHFHRSAVSTPDRTALSWEGADVTYGELLQLASSVRSALPQTGRIGLLAHRSPLAYAAVQAILSRGAAYVPLHPGSPASHNERILRLASVGTLVVGEECLDALAALLDVTDAPLEIIAHSPSDKFMELLAKHPNATITTSNGSSIHAPFPVDEPFDGTAYILFTSGSTGEPKGVRVLHSNVQSYLKSFLEAYPIRPDDRLSQMFDLTFDLSVHDQFVTWASGATLVVPPNQSMLNPLDFVRERGVTVWFSVPAVPVLLESFGLARPGALADVRLSLFCGEKLTWNALQVWRQIAPNSKVANLYGPTEATIAFTTFDVPENFSESKCHQGGIPIGKPFPGLRVEVRRPDGSICATGEEGSLWLGGPQVTPGYLDAGKTVERFVPKEGITWYRTGDIGFLGEDGEISFSGREDFQVKIMGYRIELGEIEAAILRNTGAAFCVVDVAKLRGSMDDLVCMLPTAFGKRRKEIREAMKPVLEAYMIPKVWKFQDDLPLNANGKIDRAALKAQWIAQAKDD